MVAKLIDDTLRGTDALCDRWAVEAWEYPGTAHPIYRMMKQAAGAALPAGYIEMTEEVAILDRIIASSEVRYSAIVKVWYLNRAESVSVKADKLRTSRTKLYDEWRRTLEYLRGRLHAEGVEV